MLGGRIHGVAVYGQQPVARDAVDVDDVAAASLLQHGLHCLAGAYVEGQEVHFVDVSPLLRLATWSKGIFM